MKHFLELIQEIENRKFSVSNTSKGQLIQQTERNALKQELLTALFQDLKEAYPYTYHADGKDNKGILVEIANNSIADCVEDENASGAITIDLDLKVMGLDTNAPFQEQLYNELQEEKQQKAEEKKAKIAAKIAKDKAERERKKAEIAAKKAKLADKVEG